MIATLLWKEYREHRAVWLALALVAAGALIGVPLVFPPEPGQQTGFRELLAAVTVILGWTYALVCGAMLLAGEYEGGTQGFLDTLPLRRLPLWLGKCLIGALFVVVYLIALVGLALWQTSTTPFFVGMLFGLALAGAYGLGWGLLCSALSRGVLNAVGLAILLQMVLVPGLYILLFVPVALLCWLFGMQFHQEFVLLVLTGLLLAGPYPISALLYSRVDRQRQPLRLAMKVRPVSWMSSWRPSLWLAWHQIRGVAPGLALFCLAAGVPLLASPLLFWPALTLGIGTFCGVSAFLDEQHGPYRFLGEQRFPLAAFWLVKVGMRLALALLALGVLLAPGLATLFVIWVNHPNESFAQVTKERSLSGLVRMDLLPPGLFFITWVLYGFTTGHLAGLLFRKPLVSLVVGLGLAVLLASIWVPSFIAGGLEAWQVLLVPAVLLICARLLVYLWAADRIASRAMVERVGIATFLVVGLIIGGVYYRYASIPDVAEPEGLAEFEANLPVPEDNEAGMLIRSACARLTEQMRLWERQRPTRPMFPGQRPLFDNETFTGQAHEVLERGWPAGKAELAGWLDEVFKGDWWKPLVEARNKPLGLVEDPRRLTVDSHLRTLETARTAAILLAARGLQEQAAGNPAAFVDRLDTALTLARNLENQSISISAFVGRAIEAMFLQALERWLEELDGRPDLLRRAGTVLARHRRGVSEDNMLHRMAEYLIARNTLENPEAWLSGFFQDHQRDALQVRESVLLINAWRLPWEAERQRRLLRLMHWGTPERHPTPGLVVTVPLTTHGTEMLEHRQPRRIARLEALRLAVALRQYQAEKGKPAVTLEPLVPRYIAAIPADPFDGKPFRYRLSRGEKIIWPPKVDPFAPMAGGAGGPGDGAAAGGPPEPGGAAPQPDMGGADAAGGMPVRPGEGPVMGVPAEPTRDIPAGQGILWSVGEDRGDDGGRRQGLGDDRSHCIVGEDLIYLVPLPRSRKPAR